MKSELKTYKLQELAGSCLNRDLRVNAEYQRGTKWSLSQKQALVDSPGADTTSHFSMPTSRKPLTHSPVASTRPSGSGTMAGEEI